MRLSKKFNDDFAPRDARGAFCLTPSVCYTMAAMESEGLHIVLSPETLTTIFGIPITNTLFTSVLVTLTLVGLALLLKFRLKEIPGRFQALVEALLEWGLSYMEETLESRKLAERYFPLIMTIFLFLLIANWAGLLPGIGSIGLVGEEHGLISLIYPVATDLNVTLALAIIAFIAIEVAGVVAIGFLKYAGKFVNFKSILGFFIGIIELFSEIARLVSFSFRLFGNIFAGKILILVVMLFVPLVLPVPLMVFEAFVGFIQAAIFSLLTLFFIKIAITETH